MSCQGIHKTTWIRCSFIPPKWSILYAIPNPQEITWLMIHCFLLKNVISKQKNKQNDWSNDNGWSILSKKSLPIKVSCLVLEHLCTVFQFSRDMAHPFQEGKICRRSAHCTSETHPPPPPPLFMRNTYDPSCHHARADLPYSLSWSA